MGKSGILGILEDWENWNIEILLLGILEHWNIGISEYWNIGSKLVDHYV